MPASLLALLEVLGYLRHWEGLQTPRIAAPPWQGWRPTAVSTATSDLVWLSDLNAHRGSETSLGVEWVYRTVTNWMFQKFGIPEHHLVGWSLWCRKDRMPQTPCQKGISHVQHVLRWIPIYWGHGPLSVYVCIRPPQLLTCRPSPERGRSPEQYPFIRVLIQLRSCCVVLCRAHLHSDYIDYMSIIC